MFLPGLPSFPPYPYRRQAPPLGGLAPLERDKSGQCRDNVPNVPSGEN
jgi:hypothetical protein